MNVIITLTESSVKIFEVGSYSFHEFNCFVLFCYRMYDIVTDLYFKLN